MSQSVWEVRLLHPSADLRHANHAINPLLQNQGNLPQNHDQRLGHQEWQFFLRFNPTPPNQLHYQPQQHPQQLWGQSQVIHLLQPASPQAQVQDLSSNANVLNQHVPEGEVTSAREQRECISSVTILLIPDWGILLHYLRRWAGASLRAVRREQQQPRETAFRSFP